MCRTAEYIDPTHLIEPFLDLERTHDPNHMGDGYTAGAQMMTQTCMSLGKMDAPV